MVTRARTRASAIPSARPAERRSLGRLLAVGSLEVATPDGAVRVVEGRRPGPHAEIWIHRPGLLRRILRDGTVGLGEAYMDRHFDSPDLATLLELMARNADALATGTLGRLREPAASAWERVRRSRPGAGVRSMREHYDLGNEFYSLWLDDSMTYSCAVFEHPDETLERAQARKYELLARDAGLEPGMRVLEIGSGWGAFGLHAARIGCHVTTVTIAPKQAEHVRSLAARAGMSDRVEVLVQDFRELRGEFDAVVSIEMIESIPEARWPELLATMARCLRPRGRVALQSITMAERHWPHHRGHEDFVMAYIFPGGRVPAVSVLRRLTADAGLHWVRDREIGPSYALTLAEWRRRFEAAEEEVVALGFDERFRRMWSYYLAYCEAGFRTGWTGDRQIVVTRPPV